MLQYDEDSCYCYKIIGCGCGQGQEWGLYYLSRDNSDI